MNIFSIGFELAKKDFKLRNEGSYLGVLWYLLDPLLLFLILIFLRGFIIGGDSNDYPIYLLSGLIIFNFFRHSTSTSINSITGNANLIKSMKIESEIFIISRVIQSIFSHFFEIILLCIFMLYFGYSLNWLIFYPLIFLVLVIFIMGLSFLLSTLSVFIKDLNNLWLVLTRLLWFSTPIFYYVDELSFIYLLNIFNPIFYFISIFRNLILDHMVPRLITVLIISNTSLVILIIGLLIFSKYKNKFPELLS